jgi:nitrate/TMAO reductase-like tetraheme cytochrome c subunit
MIFYSLLFTQMAESDKNRKVSQEVQSCGFIHAFIVAKHTIKATRKGATHHNAAIKMQQISSS